jgi:hypothetical protein
MKEFLLSKYPDLNTLALSTISTTLKNEMGFTYKKVSKRGLPASTEYSLNH